MPLHFSAFHPDHRMRHIPATPSRTLSRARTIAMEAGIRYVYTGNVYDPEGGTTFCPTCATPVIRRDRYVIDSYALDDHGCCTVCGTRIPGRFNAHSGSGRRRMPHRITIH